MSTLGPASKKKTSKATFATKVSILRTPFTRRRFVTFRSVFGTRRHIYFRFGKKRYKVPRYPNSYHLESKKPFATKDVDKILQNTMRDYLCTIKNYNPALSFKLCKDMVSEIKRKIHKKKFRRYKFTVWVTIIEKAHQGIYVSLGFLSDTGKDRYCKNIVETPEFYAIGIVTGIYYE